MNNQPNHKLSLVNVVLSAIMLFLYPLVIFLTQCKVDCETIDSFILYKLPGIAVLILISSVVSFFQSKKRGLNKEIKYSKVAIVIIMVPIILAIFFNYLMWDANKRTKQYNKTKEECQIFYDMGQKENYQECMGEFSDL